MVIVSPLVLFSFQMAMNMAYLQIGGPVAVTYKSVFERIPLQALFQLWLGVVHEIFRISLGHKALKKIHWNTDCY